MEYIRCSIFLFFFLFSGSIYAQNSFNPEPIDTWAQNLINEINQQIIKDEVLLSGNNLLINYNQFARNRKFLPNIQAGGQAVYVAWDRQQNRNDDCFAGVIEERLKNAIRVNCSVPTVVEMCQHNQDQAQAKLQESARKREQVVQGVRTPGAMAFAKEIRLTLIQDLKFVMQKNIDCSNEIEKFMNSDSCANTYSEVLDPIRGLIKSTCTEKAVTDQVANFKEDMTNFMKIGYADQLYGAAEKHLQARKSEIELAKHLSVIHNWIVSVENNTRAPATSIRPNMRPQDPQHCDSNQQNSGCFNWEGS